MTDKAENEGMGGTLEKMERRGSNASSTGSRRRSSLLTRARQSFVRSRGTRGASVETLRGTRGAEFEGYAKIVRGERSGFLCGCFGGGDGESKSKTRYLLVKGTFCFVFSSEDAPAPKYAIPLVHMKAEIRDVSHGHETVYLETSLGDIEYKMIFDVTHDADIARRFVSAVTQEASTAEAELAKKRLGHTHLLTKRSSTRYAESIALKKAREQPKAPISASESISNYPETIVGY